MLTENVCDRLGPDQLVGLAISRTGHGNNHIGIAYQWRGVHYLYHHAFHIDTRHMPFDEEIEKIGGATLVAALSLRPDRQRAVAGFLNSLARINPQYPYSLKYDPKARIDHTLGSLVTDVGTGLSCVTLVLAIFQSSRIRLLDAATLKIWRRIKP